MPEELSRREFVGRLTALTAAASGAAAPLKAAVIGETGHGDWGHGLDRIFLDRTGLRLVALADPDDRGRAAAQQRLGAPAAYADYRELLERERPDLVAVAPRQAHRHREYLLAALGAGAHVFCEKPLVTCPAEADEVLALAARRRLRLAVAHQMPLDPQVVELLGRVAAGELGELLEIRAYGKQDHRAGGEDLMVLGVHLFDLLRRFAGDPLHVSATVTQAGRPITVADARRVKDDVGPVAGDEVIARFLFPRGVEASFISRARQRAASGPWGLTLIGSRGAARINADIPPRVYLSRPTTQEAGGWQETWELLGQPGPPSDFDTANRRVVDDWLAAIAADREPTVSGRDGALAVEMVCGVYRAALTGAIVPFPLTDRAHPLAG